MTDYSGNPLITSSSGGWTSIPAPMGGSAAQFAVNKAGFFALAFDHSSVFLNANGLAGGWATIGGAADEIFVGSQHGLAATTLDGSKEIMRYHALGMTWSSEGMSGNTFAITQDGSLFALNQQRTGVSSNTGAGVWTPTASGGKGKLVQGSDSTGRLYSTGPVKYQLGD
jgi:hypothetical protein